MYYIFINRGLNGIVTFILSLIMESTIKRATKRKLRDKNRQF